MLKTTDYVSKIKKEIKMFSDKQKLIKYVSSKPIPQEIIKGVFHPEIKLHQTLSGIHMKT